MTPSDDRLHSRRRYVLGGLSLATAGIAGCLGSAGTDDPLAARGDNGPLTGDQPNPAAAPGAELPASNAAGSVASLPPPTRGDADADVTVVAYEDFVCPHCREYALKVVPELAPHVESGAIRYERRDFPIPVDPNWSWTVANAARAVQDAAGIDAFWRYERSLYENQSRYSLDLLAELADGVDVAGERVREAATNRTYEPVIQADRTQGVERGVTATPTVLVDGSPVTPTRKSLHRAIEARTGQ